MTGFDAWNFPVHATWEEGNYAGKTVRYEKSPEQLVEELRITGMHLWVAKGCCQECIYTPERVLTDAQVRDMEHGCLDMQMVPECVLGAVSRHRGRTDVPDCIHCYAFYYQHWHKNAYLKAVKEAELVQFWDTSAMETMRGSGLYVNGYELLRGENGYSNNT